MLQIGAKIRRRLIAHGAVFLERAVDEPSERGRRFGSQSCDGRWLLEQNRVEERRRVAARERARARDQFIKHYSQAEDVRAVIDLFPPHLLRRQVG